MKFFIFLRWVKNCKPTSPVWRPRANKTTFFDCFQSYLVILCSDVITSKPHYTYNFYLMYLIFISQFCFKFLYHCNFEFLLNIFITFRLLFEKSDDYFHGTVKTYCLINDQINQIVWLSFNIVYKNISSIFSYIQNIWRIFELVRLKLNLKLSTDFPLFTCFSCYHLLAPWSSLSISIFSFNLNFLYNTCTHL